jgi:hypothetical protein
MDESIYNLIPRPAEQVTKPPMYRSKHNAVMPPSCSTFGLSGTTKLTRNESGIGEDEEAVPTTVHVARKPHATFGVEVLGSIHPQEFTKRSCHSLPPVTEVKKFQRSPLSPKRASVPTKADKPVMGLVTEKNFIVANAVDNILAVPKRGPKPIVLATQSRSLGQVPKYLQKIKREIHDEYEYIAEMNKQKSAGQNQRMRLMSDTEKSDIIMGLKKKWDETHKQYQALTFNIDTITKVQRKEGLEVEMEQIEKAIQKLSKKNIYVYDDTDCGSPS